MSRRMRIFLLAGMGLILIFSVFLRVWHLGDQSLWIDEGYTINASQAIQEHGVPILGSGEPYRGMPLATYASAGAMSLFGFDPFSPWTARLPSVLFGILTIFAVFILTQTFFSQNPKSEYLNPKQITNQKSEIKNVLNLKFKFLNLFRISNLEFSASATLIPLTASFLVAFSYWELAWSRQARGYTAASFFIILTLYFLWKLFSSPIINHESSNDQLSIFNNQSSPVISHWSNIVFALLSFLGAYLSHKLSIVLLPALFLIIVLRVASQKKLFQNVSVKRFFAYAGGVVALSIAFFAVVPQFTSLETYGFQQSYISFLFGDIGIFFIGALIGGVLGFFDTKRFWQITSIFIALAIPVLIIAGYSPVSQPRYFFPFFPPILILFCYAIFRIIELISAKLSFGKLSFAAPFIAFIVVVVLAFPHLNFIPKDFYQLEFGSPQPDFKSAYGTINDQLLGTNDQIKPIIISPYTHLTNIYLGDRGLWLPISLTGKSIELQRRIELGTDYYTGANMIQTKEELYETIDTQSGYIVLDAMAVGRLRQQFGQERFIHAKIKELYHSGTGLNEVWVYEFNR